MNQKGELQEEEVIQALSHTEVHLTCPSEHNHAYRQVLGKVQDLSNGAPISLGNIKQTSREHRQFSFRIIQDFNQYEIVILEAVLGDFTFPLKVLNVDGNNPFASLQPHKSGTFGAVHIIPFLGAKVAIKTIAFGKDEEHPVQIMKIIKQYCLTKLASALGCGPDVPAGLGFDLVIHNDCVQFFMEQCEPLRELPEPQYEQLLLGLSKLHRFRVVHRDINPWNMMLTVRRNSVIFIDFGFSLIVAEEQGFKTQTSFYGTPEFVSGQMLHLLTLEEKGCVTGMVDLYYNDLVCLQKTFKKYQSEPSKNESMSSFLEDISRKDDPQHLFPKQKSEFLLLVLFHHELFFNYPGIDKFLQENREALFSEGTAAGILKLLKERLCFENAKEIVSQLKELSHLSQYQELKKIVDKQHEKPYLTIAAEIKEYDEKTIFEQRFSATNTISIDYGTPKIQKIIMEKLKDRNFFKLNNHEYYALLFDCIRFDRKQLDCPIKIQLCQWFLKFQDFKLQIDLSDEFKPLRVAIKLIFSFCLTQPYTEWKFLNRYHVMGQAIILDSNILSELETIERKVVTGSWDIYMCVSCLLEHLFIKNHYQFKLRFHDRDSGLKIMKKIRDNVVIIEKYLIESFSGSQIAQQQLIVSFCHQNLAINYKKGQFDVFFYEKIKRIEDEELRSAFLRILFLDEITAIKAEQSLSASKSDENWRLYAKNMNSAPAFLQQIDCNCYFLGGSEPLYCIPFIQYIKDVVNCEPIAETLIWMFMLPKTSQTAKRAIVDDLVATSFEDGRTLLLFSYFEIIVDLFSTYRTKEGMAGIAKRYLSFYQSKKDEPMGIWTPDYTDEERQVLVIESQPTFDHRMFKFSIKNYHIVHYFEAQLKNELVQQLKQFHQLFSQKAWSALNKRALEIQIDYLHLNDLLEHDLYSKDSLRGHSIFHLFKNRLQMLWTEVPVIYHKVLFYQIIQYRRSIPNLCLDFILEIPEALLNIKNFTDNLIVLAWQYCRIHQGMIYYFQEFEKKTILGQTLEVLWSKRNIYKNQVYLFLSDILNEMAINPSKTKIDVFQNNILSVLTDHPTFFDYQTLKAHFGSITANNRYLLFLYSFCLMIQKNPQTRMNAMKEIACHLDDHSFPLKSIMLQVLIDIVIQQQHLRSHIHRKLLFLHTRVLLPYLKKERNFHCGPAMDFTKLVNLSRRTKNIFKRGLVEAILKIKRIFANQYLQNLPQHPN